MSWLVYNGLRSVLGVVHAAMVNMMVMMMVDVLLVFAGKGVDFGFCREFDVSIRICVKIYRGVLPRV